MFFIGYITEDVTAPSGILDWGESVIRQPVESIQDVYSEILVEGPKSFGLHEIIFFNIFCIKPDRRERPTYFDTKD